MAPRRTTGFDDKLSRIAAIAAQPTAAAASELRRLLGEPNGYLVGEAAKAATELDLRELIPDLSAAFLRLVASPMAADKGCHGKKRLVEALLALDADAPEVYLAGLRHVQREPAFGEPIDTAAPLRGLCAHALIHIEHRDAVVEVAPLLLDREAVTRVEAATALGNSGIDLCGAVLHVKVLAGDREPDVLGACFKGLLRLAPRRYLSLVAAALEAESSGDAEAAAIALGESRLPEALPVLEKVLSRGTSPAEDKTLLLGMALLRLEEANVRLLALVEGAPEARATAAIEALALHRHDERLAEQVRQAVEKRGSRRLQRALEERFGS